MWLSFFLLLSAWGRGVVGVGCYPGFWAGGEMGVRWGCCARCLFVGW